MQSNSRGHTLALCATLPLIYLVCQWQVGEMTRGGLSWAEPDMENRPQTKPPAGAVPDLACLNLG